ncbi:MAG: hypothetical protein A2946_03710 [Candidatus Liptonbacteria bacterium RIFCSPLOWO2_01_FULL_53_13]|uniref:Uncharacterized protein n=1 Tax=Candidatus Liptonbacteria bacterium RIFCSPLOWO2_01_FULL_53_13 TaxID=1798651 RepID=A0A1G2CLD4_9BACT|nr:MAG: hypothetical protein A2946_03710 [Candidatus Liptonbacteria bacterium RIFCSPLOWO2_01_FULL_53_13]
MRKTIKKGAQKKTDKGIGVILEHIDSRLDIVVEGQHALGVQINHVDGKVDTLREEMNYKFDAVFDELHLIRNDLKEKVGRDEFTVLEKRMAVLEKRVAHISK